MARVLITGGTGTLGQALTRRLLTMGHQPAVYSRGESEQLRMRESLYLDPDPTIRAKANAVRFVIGDVRDRGALTEAARGIDWMVHAAALKQVPVAERYPLEADKTNIGGTDNAIRAAITARVERFLFISSDKCCRPTTVYGMTKAMAEREVLETASRMSVPAFSAIRYGNVLGSRGSVVLTWQRQMAQGVPLTVTDPTMTRFWQTVAQAVDQVVHALLAMWGGEVFIPKHPAMSLGALADALAGEDYPRVVTGKRSLTEKNHEELLQEGESPQVHQEDGQRYVLRPNDEPNADAPYRRYISERPLHWVEPESMRAWLAELPQPETRRESSPAA